MLAGTELPTVIVIVDDPEADMGFGLKDTVTPLGWPEADNVIDELNPPEGEGVIVDVPLEPSATETEVRDGEMVKLGPATTFKVTVAVFEISPPVPVTVIV